MSIVRSLLAACAGVALTLAVAAADDLQPIPPFGARVTDLTHTLSADQVKTLTDELAALEQRKGSRMAVLMVATTAPEEIEQYTIRVTDKWKLSRSDGVTHDGLLLTVAKDDHKVRIDPGRDLEGAIPDAAAARIIREYITPKFRAGDFYGGIHDATDALTKLIDGEQLPPPLTNDKRAKSDNEIFNAGVFAFFAIMWARQLFGGLSAPPRGGLVAAVGGGAAWLLSGGLLPLAAGLGIFGFLFGLAGGGSGSYARSSGWGGGSWGGGGSSSSSGSDSSWGGGFSGGSSGGFSGGGASGSW
jgi:uncharacterized protein